MKILPQGRRFIVRLFQLLLVGFFLGLSGNGVAQQQDYAILIVGDEGNAEMLRREKVLIGEMAKRIRKQNPSQRLPIFSYHFNKQRERTYCEKKLNVLAEDLLFVGIVPLKNKVPLKVVYRIDRIVNATRAANDVLNRAEEIVQENVTTVPVVAPPATPPVTPPATNPDNGNSIPTEVSGSGFRIQLGSFTQLKYAEDRVAEATRGGMKVSVFKSLGPDGDTLYKVLSSSYADKAAAQTKLQEFQEAGFDQAFLTRAKTE